MATGGKSVDKHGRNRRVEGRRLCDGQNVAQTAGLANGADFLRMARRLGNHHRSNAISQFAALLTPLWAMALGAPLFRFP